MIFRVIDLACFLLFFGTFPIIVNILGYYGFLCDYISSQFRDDTKLVYDFIVVGAGSAGATVANRLSKNSKVLLLEAGGSPLFYNYIPALAPNMLGRPDIDWMFRTVPQKDTQWAMQDKRSTWPRGKLLGGTSNLNYMVYVRGHPLDYDNWANITGDPEWNYENVLPFFKKSIEYNGEYYKNEKHYGQNPYGYLHVEDRHYKPLHEHFVNAGKELGYDEVDLNGPQRSGFGPTEVTQKRGERFGTFAAFLRNFMQRENLVVAKYAQATKIKLDKNNRAVGVHYIQHGKKLFAKVSKEIIVSGGTVNSPVLLMHSGIGPKGHLKSVGIKPKADLPVGKNLKDHLAVVILPFIINDTLSVIPERDFGLNTFTDYFLRGRGPLTLPTGLTSHCFLTTSHGKKECKGVDWPDMQIFTLAVGLSKNFVPDLSSLTGIRKDLLEDYLKGHGGKDAFALMLSLARVKSSGVIELADKDPLTPPRIDPRYLENGYDLKVLLEGFRFAMRIAEGTRSFQRLNTRLLDKPFPGCEKHKLRTDAYHECYIRSLGMTLYHPVGTCAMGRGAKDPKAVLDSKLRVLKTIGLRVADASIMPDIVNGNTNAPSIMIGEKAAHFVREYWSQQFSVCDRFQRFYKNYEQRCFYSNIV